MDTIQYKRATGLYYSREEAEAAVRELKDAGYDMNRISVIARDADSIAGGPTTQDVGNKADEGAATGAVTGGALGGLTGLLVGLGALAIPGIGPILLAGAEATAIATTLAGAGIGAAAGGLIGGLVGLGIPEERARIYSDRIKGGSYLVMVTGTPAEIDRAANIMHRHGVEEFDIHDARRDTVAMSPNTTPAATTGTMLDNDLDLVNSPVTAPITDTRATAATPDLSRNTTNTPVDEDTIRLYEERLVVDKDREKAGKVSIGKRVETETASVSVPIEKERIVIERTNPVNQTPVDPNTVTFGDSEVARFDVYEESAEIEKQAFVREEVTISKQVTRENVEATETIRREELEIDTDVMVM